jgi:hypothetical protein
MPAILSNGEDPLSAICRGPAVYHPGTLLSRSHASAHARARHMHTAARPGGVYRLCQIHLCTSEYHIHVCTSKYLIHVGIADKPRRRKDTSSWFSSTTTN